MHKKKKREFLKTTSISYVNEAGSDAGGLTKEWYTIVSSALMKSGLFTQSAKRNVFQPNPNSGTDVKNHLNHFHFIGRFFGKVRNTLSLSSSSIGDI